MNTAAKETRYVVAVVPYGQTMTDEEQIKKLDDLCIPNCRRTMGVWGDDGETERGFWTDDIALAFALAESLGQKAVWCVYGFRRSCRYGGVIKGDVCHTSLANDTSKDYPTTGKVYRLHAKDKPTSNCTYFVGDQITVG